MLALLRVASFAAALLVVAPVGVQAQNSDNSGALPQSDVSGALSQSDLMSFQSDEVRLRVADVAGRLRQALQTGRPDGALPGGTPLSMSPRLTALLLGPATDQQAVARFTQSLTQRGVPQAKATALAEAAAGLLSGGAITPGQLGTAGRAFNEAVDAAPDAFLLRPSPSFAALHTVLDALLQSASD